MKTKLKAGVEAEYNQAQTIIMHTPGDEIFYGALQGTAALFEDNPFDRYNVTKEHEGYVAKLKELGTEVYLIKDILMQGTLDSQGNKVENQELEELINFASKSLKISYPIDIAEEEFSKLKNYKIKTLNKLHPSDLVKIILEKPSIEIELSDEGNTDLIAKNYSCQPVMNLHFLRDQQITTDKGVVIGKMNSTQRKAETEITKFAFKKLGIEPAYEITGEGRLEGGDFIPCGNYAFIGQGLRTNEEGIKQLLENEAFGYKEVVVVKDHYKQQDEMHLDTYFNIAGPNKVVILEDRVDHYNKEGNFVKANSEKQTTVDVYALSESGKYTKFIHDVNFQDYLETKGFVVGKQGEDNSLVTLTKEEQLNYGVNFITINANEVVAVKDVSSDYLEKMKGVKVHQVNLKTFVKTYGAPHCATQVIERK